MRNGPKWVVAAGMFILLVAMIILGLRWSEAKTSTNRAIFNSKMTPTILIPGSSASQNRFDGLVKELNKGVNKHSLLKVTVKETGAMTVSGKLRSRDQAPYMVVAFENNHDGYANIKKQAAWFNKAILMLQKRYHFRRFQAIGHSNGGLIWTRYLEQYYQAEELQVNVLMTIGSPYNFAEKSINNKTQMLADFIKHRSALPTDLTVYLILGTETYDDDGIVPEESVEAGKYIFQKQVAHYTQITVTGDDAQHSDLPQNDQIVQLIQQNVLPKPMGSELNRPKS